MKNENFKEMTKWELLDKEQREIGNNLKELLEKKYYNVDVIQSNIGYETFTRGITVHIYSNDYDYKEINLKYPCDNATAEEYLETVIYCMDNNGCNSEHIASPEEKFIIDMINKYECEDMIVFYGELSSKNSNDIIYLDCIEKISFDFTNKIMEIKDDDNTYIIDFNNQTIIDKKLYLGEKCYDKIN